MKIDRNRPIGKSGTPNKGGRPASGANEFSDSLRSQDSVEAAPLAGLGGVAPPAAVDSLMALQGTDDAQDRRRQAKARAEEILDRLDELRHLILTGVVPKSRLEELARIARSQRAVVDDPDLAELLDHIDLRAQVEVAKLVS